MPRIIFTVALMTGLAIGHNVIAQTGGGSAGTSGSGGTTGSTSPPQSGTLTQPNAIPPTGVPGGSPGGTVAPDPGNPTGRTDPALGTTRAPGPGSGAPGTSSAVDTPPSGQSGVNETRPSTTGSASGASSPRRQTGAAEIPPEVQERWLQRSPEDEELNRRLQICRGC